MVTHLSTDIRFNRTCKMYSKYVLMLLIATLVVHIVAASHKDATELRQKKYCFQSYLDFHRCQKVRGEKYEPCQYFKRCFTSLCPMDWVEKWDSQRGEGTFPGKI